MAATPVLTTRQLNRATLARQMLLARQTTTAVDAVGRLAGMQAQLARPPFVGLWTRLAAFERAELIRELLAGRIVRATAMRATLHLMTADDFANYRSAVQPALDRALSWVSKRLTDADRAAVTPAGREFFATPAPFDALRKFLTQRYPKADHRALAYAIRLALPLVQVPTEADPWGFASTAPFVLAERRMKKTLRPKPDAAGLARSYLGAFGPASAADFRTWSGLPNVKEAFKALAPELVTFADEHQRELFDLDNAPRPDADAPAPIRFLPDFDNLVLAYDDRSRIIAAEHRPLVTSKNLQIAATVLVDGVVAATWKIERTSRKAALTVRAFRPLTKRVKEEIAAEGVALVRFTEGDVAAAVQFQ